MLFIQQENLSDIRTVFENADTSEKYGKGCIEKKNPIKITVSAEYSCSNFIFLFIPYCIRYKILYTLY